MESIRYRVADGIAEISLERAPANALDLPTLDALIAAFKTAALDRSARVVTLRSGIPGRFCAGLDLKTLAATTPRELHETVHRLYVELFDVQFTLGKPSIAIVEGAVRGGGMTVAVSCDMVVAASTATFGYPEIDSGLLPAIHYVHLPRIVGRQRAFDLLFTGRTFSAREACALGIVSRVAEEGGLQDEAAHLASALAAKPPETVRRGRAAFMSALGADYRREIAAAADAFCSVAATPSAREGIAAFAEKRRPVWPEL